MGRGGGQSVKQVIMAQVKLVYGTDRLGQRVPFSLLEAMLWLSGIIGYHQKNPLFLHISLPLLKLSLFVEYPFFFLQVYFLVYFYILKINLTCGLKLQPQDQEV